MKPLFHPFLVNPPTGDPGLYVEFMFESRALLFDLGDNAPLSTRKLLRVTHAFVSHTHMDHFVGLDRLIRIMVGRDKRLRLFGPPGFIENVEHKLAAYTWNLAHNYVDDFCIIATEVSSDGSAREAQFHTRQDFRREAAHELTVRDGIIVDEPGFCVRCVTLDHGIPCLGFALQESRHVNVWKNRLQEMGLPVGPWLKRLKQQVLDGRPDTELVTVNWTDDSGPCQKTVPLGELKERILRIVPGQKIVYVTDVAGQPDNIERIVELAKDADVLFIETAFLERDARLAKEKFHLTARQAGEIARQAGAKRVVPFHFSARYEHETEALRRELGEAFGAGTCRTEPVTAR